MLQGAAENRMTVAEAATMREQLALTVHDLLNKRQNIITWDTVISHQAFETIIFYIAQIINFLEFRPICDCVGTGGTLW